MYSPRSWANAFINSLEKEGLDIQDGIDTLKAFADQIEAMPGLVSGRVASEKLEELLRDLNIASDKIAPASLELVLRFLVLMVRKNMFRHKKLVIKEINKIMNKRWGVIEATVEYAYPLGDESRVIQAIKKRSGAVKVNLESRQNIELIGGYKVRIGDEIIDASVRSQLKKLQSSLQSDGGY